MLESRVFGLGIEYGRDLPARLSGITACTLGNNAKTERSACLGRKLQPPPRGQRKRISDLDHHQRGGTVAQGFLSHRKPIGLPLHLARQDPGRIDKSAQPRRIHDLLPMS